MTRLERWWAKVPQRRKQVIAAAIEREKREADAWLANAENGLLRKQRAEPLPQEDDGRDSTNVQPYAYFAQHDTRELGFDDTRNDKEGATFAAESERDERPERMDVSALKDEEAARRYLGLTSTLDKFVETAGEISGDSRASGDLKSSWSRIEAHANYYWRSDGTRIQYRGERQSPAPFPFRRTTGMAFDAETRDFFEVKRLEVNALDADAFSTIVRAFKKRSRLRQEALPDANELIPVQSVRRPKGPVRDWSGQTTDPRYQEWKRFGDFDALQAWRVKLAA
jgi:hypothetical protein